MNRYLAAYMALATLQWDPSDPSAYYDAGAELNQAYQALAQHGPRAAP